uniref:Uncharacterized protein n=1 Tax=Siphoviridae sp. ctGdK3 TaxID=2826222 RepID=A0A8S5MUW7_9CAUD|nr:MAG TPA: hypothetical protein [Siphoviridae sp. ctGdK3]
MSDIQTQKSNNALILLCLAVTKNMWQPQYIVVSMEVQNAGL